MWWTVIGTDSRHQINSVNVNWG